jgi:hypothetical protein
MAFVKIYYGGMLPIFIDFPESVTPRSCVGAMHFLPRTVRKITDEEMDFIQTLNTNNSYLDVMVAAMRADSVDELWRGLPIQNTDLQKGGGPDDGELFPQYVEDVVGIVSEESLPEEAVVEVAEE